jgi:hypothetical protein
MLDKIRLNLKSELQEDYKPQLGKGFDFACCTFLQDVYELIIKQVELEMSDDEILQGCYERGRMPDENEILIWNNHMVKLGWRDENPEIFKYLEAYKKGSGLEARSDIVTFFDFIEVDEKRSLQI